MGVNNHEGKGEMGSISALSIVLSLHGGSQRRGEPCLGRPTVVLHT